MRPPPIERPEQSFGAGAGWEPFRQSPGGFVLVEVLVAAVIALLMLAALIQFQIDLGRTRVLAVERGTAAALAEDRIETLLSQSRAGLTPPDGGADRPGSSDSEETADLYARAWAVAAGPRLVDLEVRVSWPEPALEYGVDLLGASEIAAALASGHAAIPPGPLPPP